MIELTSEASLLQRFAVDLDRTTPRPVPARPELAHHDAAAIDAARIAWAARIVDEYRSVAVFSELLHLLADLEAPFPALCAVQRIIGDELRHTQLTATVVDWLGGHADFAIDLRDIGLPARDADEPPAVRALHIVARELVVAEEESVYVLSAYRDATTEPALHAVLDIVLVDEARHAAAGRALLGLFQRGELAAACGDALAELPSLMTDDRSELRAVYRASAIGGAGRALGACIELRELEAIWRRIA